MALFARHHNPVHFWLTSISDAVKDIQSLFFQMHDAKKPSQIMNFRTSVDIMTRPVHLIGIKMDLQQTAIFLAEKRISGAPVAANGISFAIIPKKSIVSKTSSIHLDL